MDHGIHEAAAPSPARKNALTLDVNFQHRPRTSFLNYFGDTAEGDVVFGDSGPNPFDLARAGISLREAGDLDGAQAVFERLIREHPKVPFGYQEMGVLEVRRGDALRAMHYFGEAVRVEPADVLTLSHYAIHLQEMGRLDEAHAALDAFQPRSETDRIKIAAMRDFLSYLTIFHKWTSLDLANEIEDSDAFINAQVVQQQIWAAIDGQNPFSLIRLGDGEGAWMDMGPEDDAAYANLYALNRRDILKLWFGSDALLHDRAFNLQRRPFMEAINKADVIGFPYSLRLAMEYDNKSLRGAPSCNTIIRWAGAQLGHNKTKFCSNDIHIELQDAGFFRTLFERKVPIGLITCHAGLPFKMASRVGSRIVRTHLIPEEKGFSKIIGGNGMDEAHFPNVFNRVMQDLDGESQAGVVWLVSAGYLGKLYCGKIRERGGVALDIGSLTDGWNGKVTRPTLTDTQRFSL